MALGLAAGLCLASGYLIVAMGLPRRPFLAADLLLRLSLSAGFGLGVFSVTFLLARAFGIPNLLVADLSVFALLVAAHFLIRSRRSTQPVPPSEEARKHKQIHAMIAFSFAVALGAALYCATLRVLVHPHGEGWDAYSIWNLHARFLFRGGSAWRDAFSPLIPWSNPDYPLLLPAAIAHFWTYLGHESQSVPAVIGLVFTFSTVGVLYSTLAILRGCTSAMLGGMALLATPFFIEQGTSQYADVPLSFFFLTAIALLCLHDRVGGASHPRALLVLSGVAAGFAAWTKNEGLLFLCAFLMARLLTLVQSKVRQRVPAQQQQSTSQLHAGWHALAPLLAGMAPAVLLIAWFKHSVPPNDLFHDRVVALHKLLVPGRYNAILGWYGKQSLRFGDWWLVPGTITLVTFYFLANTRNARRDVQEEAGFPAAVIALAVTLAGYFAIYLITPRDIYWHLSNSLNRLFLQLWPSIIFLFFLAVPLTVKKPAYLRNISK